MLLCYFASQGIIPATVSITADTGGEEDCDWNTGEKTTARYYFDHVTKPLCDKWGIDARFVRAQDGNKHPMPAIGDYHGENAGDKGRILMPLFGSNDGRLKQNCTDRWKLAAIKQEARRMGATHLCSAQGIHAGEAAHRVKGLYIGEVNGFDHFQTAYQNKETKEWRIVKWMTHYYPLVKMRLNRQAVRDKLERLDIPYLISSECDICPHKDAGRWLRSSPRTIERAANLESLWNGEFFLTDRRRPLRVVIEEYKAEAAMNPGLFDADAATFGCDNGFCGV